MEVKRGQAVKPCGTVGECGPTFEARSCAFLTGSMMLPWTST